MSLADSEKPASERSLAEFYRLPAPRASLRQAASTALECAPAAPAPEGGSIFSSSTSPSPSERSSREQTLDNSSSSRTDEPAVGSTPVTFSAPRNSALALPFGRVPQSLGATEPSMNQEVVQRGKKGRKSGGLELAMEIHVAAVGALPGKSVVVPLARLKRGSNPDEIFYLPNQVNSLHDRKGQK